MDEHNHENSAAPQPHEGTAVGTHQRHLDGRTQRLEDLTTEALAEPDALRATVKVATAQLLDIGYRMGDEITATGNSRRAKSKSRRDGGEAINTLMLVHRQITRYVQLDQQWASEKTPNKETNVPSAEADEVG